MKLEMQSGLKSDELSFSKWDIALVGESVDARGQASIDFARNNASSVWQLTYNAADLEINIDGQVHSAEDIDLLISRMAGQSVLLEATTLGFVEILLCCRALMQGGHTAISFLYTEPKDYFRPQRSKISHRSDFELSAEVEQFSSVPGNSLLLSPNRPIKAAAFVGYESQRLDRFFETTGISISKCSILMGVPAFQPGWEMFTFANTFRVLKGEQLSGRVMFCGAQNPLAAFEALERIFESCRGERLLIAPIGTKPHGIAAALFLCLHNTVGVIYDNPKRKIERAGTAETWHLFEAQF